MTRGEQDIALDVEASDSIGKLKAEFQSTYGRIKVIVKSIDGMWIMRESDMDLSDTIDEVKAKAQAKYGTSPDMQFLTFDACVGAEGRTLFIHSLSGEPVVLEAGQGHSIAAIKQMIANEKDIPPEHQRLFYEGLQLHSRFNLLHYNIPDQASLQLIVVPLKTFKSWEDYVGQDHPPGRRRRR